MMLSQTAGTKLERFIEKEIEEFLFKDGWSIETSGGDHLAIQYEDDNDEFPIEVTINVSAMARHLAEAANA